MPRLPLTGFVISIALVSGCGSHGPAALPSTTPPPSESPKAMGVLAPGRAPLPRSAAELITEQSIRAHMEFLASDALNGRASGSRDEWIAAAYIASQFRQWGLEPMGDDGGYVQTVALAAEEAVAPPALTIGGRDFTHGKEMLVTALGRSGLVNGPLRKYARGDQVAPGAIVILPADAAQPADLKAVAGAALILTSETPQQRSGWEAAAGRLPALPLRAIKLPAPATARPTRIVLSSEAHAFMSGLRDGTTLRFTADTKLGEPTAHTWNAVARLTGSDPALSKDVIVLSAHLDHVGMRPTASGPDKIYNGADDDASGTVAVMALAHALAQGARPKRTVVFALFGSEETGGRGAGFFVDLPVVPLEQIVADLQFEMLGRPDPLVPAKSLWLTGYERSNLGAELAKQGARLVADPRPDQSFFTRSDNIRFARRGVVAHTVSSFNLHKEYHQPSDEIGLIDFAHMTEAVRSLLEPVRWLANSTFRPEWAPNGCPAPCR